jgi:aryl-alcohol dehydrogenase-like predicted oxidoreductase
MEQRRLGNRTVSALGLGGMPMSVRQRNDEQLGVSTIHRALEEGITLIDTADAYSPDEDTFGHNEDLVARALREYGAGADDVLVATKGGHTRRGTDWELDGRPEYLRDACEASLKRLGVDRIDLYQHHRPDPRVEYVQRRP